MPSQAAPTLSLQSLLRSEHIQLGLAATSKKRVFEEIGFLFERTAKLDRALVTDSLFARERLGSTGLGHGVAIPHGRIKGLKEPHMAMIQLATPIAFDAVDDAPVCLLFALLVPENASQKHLDLLSDVAQLLGDEGRREPLKTVESNVAALAILNVDSLL